jgi:hypothetical protein
MTAPQRPPGSRPPDTVTAWRLLSMLRWRGFVVALRGRDLVVEPRSELTGVEEIGVQLFRRELADLLRAEHARPT